MRRNQSSYLSHKKRYLQIALNSTLDEAGKIIGQLPKNDRILIEVGTPLIKQYGEAGIRQVRQMYERHLFGLPQTESMEYSGGVVSLVSIISELSKQSRRPVTSKTPTFTPYIVADLKTMDRAEAEVSMAARAGAGAAVALGSAPIETLNSFIEQCAKYKLDAMIDMMNIDYPLSVLRALKQVPAVVILHRGVDEEKFNREKMIPLHEIRRIKGAYDIMIAIAGGDSLREIQRSIFNDADIVVVWKSVYENTEETAQLVEGFLKAIK